MGRFGEGGFGRRNFGPRRDFRRQPAEKHKAVCSECKKECEVPFKPTEGRPVYCAECFAKHREDRQSRFAQAE